MSRAPHTAATTDRDKDSALVIEVDIDLVAERLEAARSRLALTTENPTLATPAEFVEAFDLLLDAWRLLRAAEIAELCEIFSARAARGKSLVHPQPGRKKDTERVIAWTKAFHERTPLGLGLLIADLDAALATAGGTDEVQPRFIFPRVEALATVQDDPRVSSAMVRVALGVEAGGAWRKVLPQCVRAFQMSGDPRFVAQLDAAIAKHPTAPGLLKGSPLGPGAKALKTLRGKLKNGPPLLPQELTAVVQAIRMAIEGIPKDLVIATPARAKAVGADPAALLDEVRASPDDYELRLVLADALVNIDDPLGEFIVLQCRRANGESTDRTISRERVLLEMHRRTWLGPLASVVTLKSAVFEGGFLSSCEAIATKRITAEVHFAHAEWATVRSIHFHGESRITPVMRSLREAFGVDATGLAQLVASGHPRLERINLNIGALTSPLTGPQPNENVRAFAASEKLPRLAHLELDTSYVGPPTANWVWNAHWVQQLRSLSCLMSNATEPWLDELSRRDHLEEIGFLTRAGYRSIVRKRDDGLELTIRVELQQPASASIYGYTESAMLTTLRSFTSLRKYRFRDVKIDLPKGVTMSNEQRQRLDEVISRRR